MTNPIDDAPGPASITPWDRRVVNAMAVADAARTGVVVLRIIALLVAGAGVVGPAMYLFGHDVGPGQGEIYLSPYTSDRYTTGAFLSQIAAPLAWGGLLLALSFLISVYAARLDLDIVAADTDEAPTD